MKRRTDYPMLIAKNISRNQPAKSVLIKNELKGQTELRNGMPVKPARSPNPDQQSIVSSSFAAKRASLPAVHLRRNSFQRQFDSKRSLGLGKNCSTERLLNNKAPSKNTVQQNSDVQGKVDPLQTVRRHSFFDVTKDLEKRMTFQIEKNFSQVKKDTTPSLGTNLNFGLFLPSPRKTMQVEKETPKKSQQPLNDFIVPRKVNEFEILKKASLTQVSTRSLHKMRKSFSQIRDSQLSTYKDTAAEMDKLGLQRNNFKRSSADDLEVSDSDTEKSMRESLPGQIKTGYALDFKMGLEKK